MPTPDRLRIGVNQAANYLSGHSRSLQFYSVAKIDAELQAADRHDLLCRRGAEREAGAKRHQEICQMDRAGPGQSDVDVLWNGAVAMIAGCKLIVGYQMAAFRSITACTG